MTNRAGSAGSGHGSVTDVAGIRVGHFHRRSRAWRTGTTVILAPPGTTCGVDVRGGGPGTRETDLLRPENLVNEVHAVCLTGGSAYGLSAADGVMRFLEEHGIGFPVGADPRDVVPIVPAAVIFDLGRGGVFANRPDADFGYRAAAQARRSPPALGTVGAATGAVAGRLQGGFGTASQVVDGIRVAAAVVVNSVGAVIDPDTGLPWEHAGLRLRRPSRGERHLLAELTAAPSAAEPPSTLNTTIGVVATSAQLTKAECQKVAAVAHDGLARAVRPAHTLFDGDTIFALATGANALRGDEQPGLHRPSSRAAQLSAIAETGAQCFAIACTIAILSATSIGGPLAYRDICPSALSPTPGGRDGR